MITIKKPDQCAHAEKKAFCELVAAGGEVSFANVVSGIERAQRLAFAHEAGELAGVGSLKTPLTRYKEKIFRKAKCELDANSFVSELGYVSVSKEHRGKGYSTKIAEALLKGHDVRTFATSAVGNTPMHRTLVRAGFERVGQPYESENDSGKTLVLFARQ